MKPGVKWGHIVDVDGHEGGCTILLEVPHSPALPPGLQQGLQGLPVRERAQWGSLAPPLGPSSQAPTHSPSLPLLQGARPSSVGNA